MADPRDGFTRTRKYDDHGRLWITSNALYEYSIYNVDLNLVGLSPEAKDEMESTPGYCPNIEHVRHYRTLDVSKTGWEERMIATQDVMPGLERYARLSVQERYGDVRLSLIGGETCYSTPRAFVDLDRYTEMECALFLEPGRTLDVLAGLVPFDTLPPGTHLWICPCGVGLDFACERLHWECKRDAKNAGDAEDSDEQFEIEPDADEDAETRLERAASGTIIASYVPVEDIHWLQRQLAARRNMNVLLRNKNEDQGTKPEPPNWRGGRFA